MFNNYLKIAFRNLLKHKVYTFINVLGLAIAMATVLPIYLFVENELRFDGFHQKADLIYRLNEVQSFPGIAPQKVALSMYPMGPTLKQDFPEVREFARTANMEAFCGTGNSRWCWKKHSGQTRLS
jgi:putative ABC transport system permease protein